MTRLVGLGNAFALLAFATTTLAGPNRKHRGHKNQCIRQLECWLTIFLVLLAIVLVGVILSFEGAATDGKSKTGKSGKSTKSQKDPNARAAALRNQKKARSQMDLEAGKGAMAAGLARFARGAATKGRSDEDFDDDEDDHAGMTRVQAPGSTPTSSAPGTPRGGGPSTPRGGKVGFSGASTDSSAHSSARSAASRGTQGRGTNAPSSGKFDQPVVGAATDHSAYL